MRAASTDNYACFGPTVFIPREIGASTFHDAVPRAAFGFASSGNTSKGGIVSTIPK